MQIVELEMVPLSLRPVLQRLYDMKTTQSALREGVLFSTKRNNYYYDTGTGKVIVLDDDTSYIFRVLFDPTLSAETFLISLTKVDPNAVKNLLQTIDAERLFQRPPLLSMGKEIAAGVTDTEQKVEQIILEVTEQCNFRCKYCVYSEDFSGNRDFGNRRMPTEIAFKAIDWALENSGAKLAITFYGGEPLLNFKLMKAVIERSQAKRGNKEIVYSFTSNMSLMTREIATYLAQVPNLYIMASIDGPRTVHDAYRVYANDAPTFEDSIGGLRILADAYAGSHMPVNINAVLTPPFGFEKLEQVNAYFESLDWLPATCHVNITYPSYGTCPGLDEYYDKITGNPKYALHGMCNPLMIWQQRKAETDGLDAYKARNIYLACAVSWGIAVWFAGRLWAAYPLVSVRSDVPVTGRQLEALRSALRQEDGASALVPAFWSQAEGSAESRWETCGITAILYCGEYDAVYPAVLLEGRFPAAQENGKCAVSTAAAWQLWGSEDVLGQELEIEGDIYRVCGLFRSSASLALCGESLDHGFSNIEFWGGYAAPPVETVQQLLRAAGIAQQVTLYFPFPWMAALTAYALCPAGLVLLAAARTLGGRVRRGCPKETCWFVLGGAFLLALVLPALLRLLPPWITPARWSDFSYWGGLLPAVGKAIETGFSLNPCAKDVLAKWNTLGLLIAATLANAAAGKLMLSRQQKNSTNL